MDHPLVLPMLVLMAIPLFMVFLLAMRRVGELKKAGSIKALRKAGGFTAPVINMSDNLKNQFEMPVVFYGLCLLFITTGYEARSLVIAAWIYVVLRFIHMLIQCTSNKIFPNRFVTFGLSMLVLIFIWGHAVIQVLGNGAG